MKRERGTGPPRCRPSPGRSFLPRHRTKRITREKKGNGSFVGSKDISRTSFLLLRDGCSARCRSYGCRGRERERPETAQVGFRDSRVEQAGNTRVLQRDREREKEGKRERENSLEYLGKKLPERYPAIMALAEFPRRGHLFCSVNICRKFKARPRY